jgi:hypothetical protein
VLLLRRRAPQPPAQNAEAAVPAAPPSDPKPAVPGASELENTYDPKRGSVYTASVPASAASSPPPAAQGLPGPGQHGGVMYYQQPYQPQYGVPPGVQPVGVAEMPSMGAVEMPSLAAAVEMPGYPHHVPGAVEMNAQGPSG